MTTSSVPEDPQLRALEERIRSLGSAVVCFSGGVDSAFVLLVAHRVLGDRAIGLTAVSPSLAPSEKEGAIRVAKAIAAPHVLVETNEIENENYAANPSNRCFYCKTELYSVARDWSEKNDFSGAAILNGTNVDDLGDYRPGLDAAKDAQIVSPLLDVGMRKEDVRRCAKLLGLGVWDKPASACLSSRLPYGTAVTRERLQQIGGLEEDLRALGFQQVRVRWHETSPAASEARSPAGDLPESRGGKSHGMARIEIAQDEMARAFTPEVRSKIVAAGKRHGFTFVTLDLQGYRQGSQNELLPGNALRVI